MNDKIVKITHYIREKFFATVLRHALSMMIPVIIAGGLAKAILNIPINQYQDFINSTDMQWLVKLLTNVDNATFGIFSLALAISVSISFAMELNESADVIAMYGLTGALAFATQFVFGTDDTLASTIGVSGCFSAIVNSYVACKVHMLMRKNKHLTLYGFTMRVEGVTATAISCIFPVIVIGLLFSLINDGIYAATGIVNLNEGFRELVCGSFKLFDDASTFITGLVYTLLLHILWFFGMHGSHLLEPVALDIFAFRGEGQIFSKAFFDVFVVMGGCGTTICVLIYMIFHAIKKKQNNIAVLAVPTVLFNLNELLNFGIPIILNPILMLPFIITPVMCYCVSYCAVALNLVPTMVREVTWTTPVLLSGYIATDSIRGTILQLVCIVIGIAIYAPFLKLNRETEDMYARKQLGVLIGELQEAEDRHEHPKFLTRSDKTGVTSRMLLKDLEKAIEKKELYMLFQPQITDEGRCMGAEALLRWKHPVYGNIYPPLIVYLAKEGNLLEKVEEQIFEIATEAIEETAKVYDGHFKISVNITARSLLWDIEACIKKKMRKHNVEPDKLWIEITEQEMITHSDMVINKINRLKKVGHVLLIDDFGMGHTSLLYLQSNYFDVVKLDGSLVKNLLKNTTNQKIVKSVVELADTLDVKVIAEYVETEEQRDLLSSLGCKWYQGYLYSKPVELKEFIYILCEYNKE